MLLPCSLAIQSYTYLEKIYKKAFFYEKITLLHKTVPQLGEVNAALLIICVRKIASGYVFKNVVCTKEDKMMTKAISEK